MFLSKAKVRFPLTVTVNTNTTNVVKLKEFLQKHRDTMAQNSDRVSSIPSIKFWVGGTVTAEYSG